VLEERYSKIVNISEIIKVVIIGESYGVIYLPINDFVKDLNVLVNALDYVEKSFGEVTAVIPNIGLTSTSMLLGPAFPVFQGVKGLAIIFKRRK
jgi:predicted AlkP superfamily phosphohydrolase/phosphomutase